MTHFIMPYAGNKRNEYKDFIKEINIDRYDIVVEPFCGSSAISFNIWCDNPNKNIKYFLNDIDKDLINIYKLIKKSSPENILSRLDKILSKIQDKETYVREFKKEKKNIYEILFFKKYSGIREGMYPLNHRSKTKFRLSEKQILFFDFIKSDNVYITNADWEQIFNEFKNNKKALIIFDPPYLDSCNEFYEKNKNSMNVYEYFNKNSINKYKSTIFFMLEDIPIIREIFNGNIVSRYSKKYEISGKITNHIIINNL